MEAFGQSVRDAHAQGRGQTFSDRYSIVLVSKIVDRIGQEACLQGSVFKDLLFRIVKVAMFCWLDMCRQARLLGF